MSQPRLYRPRMIDVGSLAGLLEHHHQLDAYCPRCDRWCELPLAELVAAGHGARRLPVRVRPPVPTRGPGGWMEPVQQP